MFLGLLHREDGAGITVILKKKQVHTTPMSSPNTCPPTTRAWADVLSTVSESLAHDETSVLEHSRTPQYL